MGGALYCAAALGFTKGGQWCILMAWVARKGSPVTST